MARLRGDQSVTRRAGGWRQMARGRLTPSARRADQLDRGEVIVVQGWQLGSWRPSSVPLYGDVRIERDGSLTLVHPIIELVDGIRHTVCYEPATPPFGGRGR